MERKLTAILCADVFGYSRLMGDNEEATHRTLISHRRLIDSLLDQHHGRFVNSAGDSVLAEFASVVNAVQCAVEVQSVLKVENARLAPERRMEFRIGVNLGDVIVDGDQIYGDGVNVAARLESLAEPGGICISGIVHDQVSSRLALSYADLGEQAVKNIAKPVRVFRVLPEGTVAPRETRRISRRYWRGGVLSLTGLAIIAGTIVLVQNLSLRPPHTHASIPPQEKPALPLPSIPSIAVLPFANLSGDPKQEYFSDGITDDLVTDLSRLPGVFVIDRNSTFVYKGKPAKVQEVGRELGVKYVLEGSARKVADQVRVNAQLVDASTGKEVWSQSYDKQFRDIFKLQDDIVRSLVATLDLQLPLMEKGLLLPQRTENLEAYDYFLRAFEYLCNVNEQDNIKARIMFQKAIELDPGYADAYCWLGFSYLLGYFFQWDRPGVIDRAVEVLNKSLSLDDSNAYAYAVRGWIEAPKNQRDQAIADCKRAVALDPNSALAWQALADISNLFRKPNEAIDYIHKAMRLDPRHPEKYADQVGESYMGMGRYSDAIAVFRRDNPNDLWAHVNLIIAYSELGREQEARAETAEVLRVSPKFTLKQLEQTQRTFDWKDPIMQHVLADLRKAGLK